MYMLGFVCYGCRFLLGAMIYLFIQLLLGFLFILHGVVHVCVSLDGSDVVLLCFQFFSVGGTCVLGDSGGVVNSLDFCPASL